MKLLRIKRRHSIIVEGQSANEMICVLLSGVVKVSAMNGEASPVLMGVVVAGEIFGLHSLLDEPVHRFQCEAFTDCLVGQIPGRTFSQIVLPQVPFDSFKSVIEMSLGRWWWGLPVWYSRMTRLSVHDRVIAMFWSSAENSALQIQEAQSLRCLLVVIGLAEMIGASRQTVSLEIEELVRDGSLIRDGRRLLVTKSAHSRPPRHKL